LRDLDNMNIGNAAFTASHDPLDVAKWAVERLSLVTMVNERTLHGHLFAVTNWPSMASRPIIHRRRR
jgi:hypothetical protein